LDFLRAGAIPALTALGVLALPAAAAPCSIDGTYRFRSESSKGETETFNRLVVLPQGEGRKLFKLDNPQAPQQGFGGSEPRARPKYTALAVQAQVAGSRVRFLDAAGKVLAEGKLDSGGKWTCRGERLERSSENMAGVGDEIRTDRLDESLRREGDALVYSETRTTIDPPGGKPRASEMRFGPAP